MSLPFRPLRSRAAAAFAVVPLALATALTGLVVFLTAQTTSSPPAAANPGARALQAARPGAGYTFGRQWFGTWRTYGGGAFCIEFDKSGPNSRGPRALNGNVPGMSAEQSARVKYVVNRYGNTGNRVDGAAAAIVVWKIQNTSRFNRFYAGLVRARQVPARVQRRAAQIAAEARLHGPYTLAVAVRPAYVGQSMTGTVTARTRSGRVVAGLPVTLRLSRNAALVRRTASTDARGQIAFTYRVTGVGTVRADAALSRPSARAAYISTPSAGRQRLVVAGRSADVARGFATAAQRTVGAAALRSACSEDCKGSAPVTVTRSNQAGAATIRQFVHVNNSARPVATFDVPGGTTRSTRLAVADNALVTTKYCYLQAGRCASAPVAAPAASALRVVCPAWVQYTFVGSCPCDGTKSVTYAVEAPRGSVRDYTVRLTKIPVGGRAVTETVRLSASGGRAKTFGPVTLGRGDRVQLTFTVLGRTHTLDGALQQF